MIMRRVSGSQKHWLLGLRVAICFSAISSASAQQNSTGIQFVTNNLAKVSFGEHHSCALLSHKGSVLCVSGEAAFLGEGALVNRSAHGENFTLTTATTTTLDGIPSRYTDVVTGAYHTCALDSSGAVDCWGYAAAFSNATASEIATTARIVTTNATHVAASAKQTCVITESETDGAIVRCWGNGDVGYSSCSLEAEWPEPQTCRIFDLQQQYFDPTGTAIPTTIGANNVGFGWWTARNMTGWVAFPPLQWRGMGPFAPLNISQVYSISSDIYSLSTIDTTMRAGAIVSFRCNDNDMMLNVASTYGCDFDGKWKPVAQRAKNDDETGNNRTLLWEISSDASSPIRLSIDCTRTVSPGRAVCLPVALDLTIARVFEANPSAMSVRLPCVPQAALDLALGPRSTVVDAATAAWAAQQRCGLADASFFVNVRFHNATDAQGGSPIRSVPFLLSKVSQQVLDTYSDPTKRSTYLQMDLWESHDVLWKSALSFRAMLNSSGIEVTDVHFLQNSSLEFSVVLTPAAFLSVAHSFVSFPFRHHSSLGSASLCTVLNDRCPTTSALRPFSIPTLRGLAISMQTYLNHGSVVSWVNGGSLPSQQSLAILWRQSLPTNTTFSTASVGEAVLSDGLPPSIILVQASTGTHDYTGIQCTMQGDILNAAIVGRVQVHVMPASLVSPVPSSAMAQHYHIFQAWGMRSLQNVGDSLLAYGSLRCSPTFPPGGVVPYVPVVTVPVSLYTAAWAVPRGASLRTQSGSISRDYGMALPSCFNVRDANRTVWHNCSQGDLDQFARQAAQQTLQPTWSPLSFDLNGETNITFILQLTNIPLGKPALKISINIGGHACAITNSIAAANFVLIQCTSPAFALGCAPATGSTDCSPQRLSVGIIGDFNINHLDKAGTGFSASLVGRVLSTLVRCEPFCDALGTPSLVYTTVRDASMIGFPDGSAMYDVGSLSPYPLVVSMVAQRPQRRPPITYVDVCIGYVDPFSGVCLDASSPAHLDCAYGGGDSCRRCPRGALCPGGFRAIPKVGFWTATISTPTVVECAPPAERCGGWDIAADRVICGDGYDPTSPACGWCAESYYKMRGTQKCIRCPSTDDPVTIMVPMLLLVASVAFIGCFFVSLVWAVARYFGGTVKGGLRRTLEFASALFQSVQLVSTVTSATADALPDSIRPVVNVLNALQVQGILVDEACLKDQDPYMRVYVLSGFALTMALPILVCHFLWKARITPMQAFMAKVMALFFACYGIVGQAVMATYQCSMASMPLRAALPILKQEADAGKSVLAANRIDSSLELLSRCDANEFLEGCASVSVLLGNSVDLGISRAFGKTVICGGSLHVPALATATATFVVALCAIPIVVFLAWRDHMKAIRRSPSGTKGAQDEKSDAEFVNMSANPLFSGVDSKSHPTPPASAKKEGALSIFLLNQRYMTDKAYWWLLDSLLLLFVAAAIHVTGKPSTLVGIWGQAIVVCCSCLCVMTAKIIIKPYKPENFHLFVTAIAVQVYFVLIQLLLGISYAAELAGADSNNFQKVQGPFSLVCLAAALILLLTVISAFGYSLIHGAIVERREQSVTMVSSPSKQTEKQVTLVDYRTNFTKVVYESDLANYTSESKAVNPRAIVGAPRERVRSTRLIAADTPLASSANVRDLVSFEIMRAPARNIARHNGPISAKRAIDMHPIPVM